jgi:hypothetical protein
MRLMSSNTARTGGEASRYSIGERGDMGLILWRVLQISHMIRTEMKCDYGGECNNIRAVLTPVR